MYSGPPPTSRDRARRRRRRRRNRRRRREDRPEGTDSPRRETRRQRERPPVGVPSRTLGSIAAAAPRPRRASRTRPAFAGRANNHARRRFRNRERRRRRRRRRRDARGRHRRRRPRACRREMRATTRRWRRFGSWIPNANRRRTSVPVTSRSRARAAANRASASACATSPRAKYARPREAAKNQRAETPNHPRRTIHPGAFSCVRFASVADAASACVASSRHSRSRSTTTSRSCRESSRRHFVGHVSNRYEDGSLARGEWVRARTRRFGPRDGGRHRVAELREGRRVDDASERGDDGRARVGGRVGAPPRTTFRFGSLGLRFGFAGEVTERL